MPLLMIRNDITRMETDAIVNAANAALMQGGGVCGAIFSAAGAMELAQACSDIGYCDTGCAVITGGYRLPAKYIIHAVGPVWHGGQNGEETQLSACYANSLALAQQNGIRSIAFPLISSGIYGYPKEEALRVAVQTINAFLTQHEMEVYLVVFDEETLRMAEELLKTMNTEK